jgi:phage tail sheath gpL-like
MVAVPSNPELASSWAIPGVYFSINLAGQGAGLGTIAKRLLLLGYRLSTGTQPVDQPFQVNGQDDVNQGAGQGSDLSRLYAAAMAQIGQGVVDVWCLGVNEPSSGAASTHLIAIAGTATEAGSLSVWICGYLASIAIASGDSAATIATNLKAEIDKLKDLPVTASINSGTITLTYRHKGAVGNDLPVRVDQDKASGITVSPGTITIANAAQGNGSAQLKVSTTTITAAIADQDTANAIAAALNTAINAGGYPVTSTVSNGVVTLLYAKGRYVHRISAAIISTTGTTATAAVGTVAPDNAANRPTLTTALTNLKGLPAFKAWATSFNEAGSLGTISTHIESEGDGKNQKGQVVHVASTDALATAGAIPDATTPKLTASPRYAVGWCPEPGQQAYELAARTAALVCAEDYAPRNYDGFKLKTDSRVPLLLPPRAIRPAPPDINSAIHTYYLTPLAVDEVAGALVIVSGKTTSASADLLLHDWGTILHLDYMRFAFNERLWTLFKGTHIRRNGTPHTPNTITVQSIVDAAYVMAIELDAVDLYDGAEAFKAAFKANFDPFVPTRVNCFIPMAVIRSLHQLGIVGAPL